MTDYRIWPATDGPAADGGPDTSVNLGVEFKVTASGLYVKAIHFWRGATTINGPVLGRIWAVVDATSGTAVTGTDVTFSLSGTGWQTATLSAPIALTANTRYKAVCLFPDRYSITQDYFTVGGPGENDIVNGPLLCYTEADGTGGKQGTYVADAGQSFPVNAFHASNYWVDVTVTDAPHVVGIASETDTAIAFGRFKSRAFGIAPEIDTATALGRAKSRTLGLATSTTTALPIARTKSRALGTALDTSTSLAVVRSKTRALGIATESDTALVLSASGGARTAWPPRAGTVTVIRTATGTVTIT